MNGRGFTLIELLVVVAIIGLLASIIEGSLNTARTKGKNAANLQLDANFYHNLGDSLVGQWLFDECSGTSAKDTSGSGDDAVLSSSAWSNDTPFGTGCSLISNVSAASAPMPSLTIVPNRTISLWLKRQTSTSIGYFVSDNSFGFGVNVDACPGVSNVKMTKYGVIDVCINGLPDDSNWHLVIGVWRTTGTTLYIDGVPVGTNADGSNFHADTTALSFAGFNGNLDNVRIYDRALDTAEIQKLYAEEAPRHAIAFVSGPTELPFGRETSAGFSRFVH